MQTIKEDEELELKYPEEEEKKQPEFYVINAENLNKLLMLEQQSRKVKDNYKKLMGGIAVKDKRDEEIKAIIVLNYKNLRSINSTLEDILISIQKINTPKK